MDGAICTGADRSDGCSDTSEDSAATPRPRYGGCQRQLGRHNEERGCSRARCSLLFCSTACQVGHRCNLEGLLGELLDEVPSGSPAEGAAVAHAARGVDPGLRDPPRGATGPLGDGTSTEASGRLPAGSPGEGAAVAHAARGVDPGLRDPPPCATGPFFVGTARDPADGDQLGDALTQWQVAGIPVVSVGAAQVRSWVYRAGRTIGGSILHWWGYHAWQLGTPSSGASPTQPVPFGGSPPWRHPDSGSDCGSRIAADHHIRSAQHLASTVRSIDADTLPACG